MFTPIPVEKVATLAGHADALYAVTGTDQPHEVVSAGGDGMVAVWDLRMPDLGKLVAQIPASVYALAFSADHQLLAVGHNHDGVHLIDWHTRTEVASYSFTQAAIFHLLAIDNVLIAACGDGMLHALHLPTLAPLWQKQFSTERARKMAYCPALKHLAIGYSDSVIRILDLTTGMVVHELRGHHSSVFALAYSHDGSLLYSGGRDAHLRSWKVQENYAPHQDVVAHMYAINDMALSPDGQWLATVSMDKSTKLWKLPTLQLHKVIDKARHAGHATSVNAVYWSYYCSQIITASDDRKLAVWQIEWPSETPVTDATQQV